MSQNKCVESCQFYNQMFCVSGCERWVDQFFNCRQEPFQVQFFLKETNFTSSCPTTRILSYSQPKFACQPCSESEFVAASLCLQDCLQAKDLFKYS